MPPSVSLPIWPLRSRLLAWSVPTVLGVPYVLFIYAASGQSLALWRVLSILVATWQVWTLLTWPIAALADRFPVDGLRPVRPIAIHFGASVIAVVMQAAATTVTALLVADDETPWPSIFAYWFSLLMPAGVIVYGAIVAVRSAVRQHAQRLERERQAQQLAAQLAVAQLQALRSQVQPHFLFNALNAVVALVRDQDTPRAVAAITSLAELLRHSLRFGPAHEVRLDEDLTFCRHYLALEAMRFGDRLHVKLDAPDDVAGMLVPTLLLQPFVENAVRHGLRPTRSPMQLTITARREGDSLRIEVADTGSGLPADVGERIQAGVGISNARERLRQLHGEAASVQVEPRAEGGTRVTIRLPATSKDQVRAA